MRERLEGTRGKIMLRCEVMSMVMRATGAGSSVKVTRVDRTGGKEETFVATGGVIS